ncbi:hypothetical protein BJ944DRAFT_267302 [Cunninghamella echinulata]|nr:hypothetical protein BJ944DRAFT_267302 [Cunninghamella echinulata]
MVSNKQVIFSKVPTGYPVAGEHITIKTTEFDLDQPLNDGEFITKTLDLSVDPYFRGRMRDASIKSYSPAFIVDEPLNGHVMLQVVRSKNNNYKEGDLLYGYGKYEEYVKYNDAFAKALRLVVRNDPKENGLPISNYVGVLGMPGMTAYVGLFKIGEIKKGETIYISAASGAVGQLAGQIAKAHGLRVVGSASTDDKVAYLKEIGFDGAFNYRTEDSRSKLAELCPNGIDVYFENVGGETLEIVIDLANDFARIIACGMISQYNTTEPYPIRNLIKVVSKRLKIQGYIVSDYAEVEPEFREYVTKALLDGKIKYKEDITNGIEYTPEALINVLTGKNFGKAVVHVADL